VAAGIPPAGVGRTDFSRLNRFRLDDDNFERAIQKLEGLLSKNPKHSLANLYLAKAYTTQAEHQLKSARESKNQAIKYYQKISFL
jgi:Tfp pilus assembly protein PilF